MTLPHHKVYNYYQEYGLSKTIIRLLRRISQLFFSLTFAVCERLTGNRDSICIVPRTSKIDQDTIAILEELENKNKYTVSLAVTSPGECKKSVERLSSVQKDDLNIVEINTFKFVRTISRSPLVITKTYGRLNYYNLFSGRGTTFLRVYHGITLKGNKIESSSRYHPSVVDISFDTLFEEDIMSVGSDFQRFHYSAQHDIALSRLQKYGYPRFDRVERLIKNESEPILPTASEQLLEESSGYFNILYAPTHKSYQTNLFPFANFRLGEFQNFLKENQIRIFIRLHPTEEGAGIHEEFVDNETIYNGGSELSSSSIDILPYMDALITDYSSIYMDYIKFDRPIIFVKDNHQEFISTKGLGLDYDTYFPGPKFGQDDYKAFQEHLVKIALHEDDPHEYQRQFVKDTFIEDSDTTFTEDVISEHF